MALPADFTLAAGAGELVAVRVERRRLVALLHADTRPPGAAVASPFHTPRRLDATRFNVGDILDAFATFGEAAVRRLAGAMRDSLSLIVIAPFAPRDSAVLLRAASVSATLGGRALAEFSVGGAADALRELDEATAVSESAVTGM